MNVKIFIIILIILCILIIMYFKITNPDMTYVISDIDNQYYLVRNVSDKQQAANTLARMRQNLINLSKYLYENKNNEENKKYIEYIDILHNKINDIIILESTQDSIYTSYSVNKGEQIVFCVRSIKSYNIHDINLMMYVALHEISHVACPVYDNHGPLFREIFAFITNTAINMKIYTKIDFNKNEEEYCGLNITDSIV
jgi:hypothetical protein